MFVYSMLHACLYFKFKFQHKSLHWNENKKIKGSLFYFLNHYVFDIFVLYFEYGWAFYILYCFRLKIGIFCFCICICVIEMNYNNVC
jgi:hypothetical protein